MGSLRRHHQREGHLDKFFVAVDRDQRATNVIRDFSPAALLYPV
jgi:hypothetical protein